MDTVVAAEKNYYQDFFDFKSCLTINGFNSSGEPASLNFELMNEDGEWKFNYVQMMYHESNDKFPISVKCPIRPKI